MLNHQLRNVWPIGGVKIIIFILTQIVLQKKNHFV